MNKKIVITRAQQQSQAFAYNVVNHACGLSMNDLIIESMTHVTHFPINIEQLKAYDGIIITSSNAVTSLNLSAPKAEIIGNMAFFCVGERTKENIENLGEGIHVEINAPTVKDLVEDINKEQNWNDKQLLYLRGRDVAFDVKTDICDGENINHLEEVICYDAKASQRLTPNFIEALLAGKVGAVSFFSKRTAEIFVRLMEHEYGKETLCPADFEGIKALAISDTALECLERVFKTENCIISKTPDMDGMIVRIEEGLF